MTTAIDVFAESFAFIRSQTRPAEVMRRPHFWLVRDVAVSRTPRTQEVLVEGVEPVEAVRMAREELRPGRHALDIFTPTSADDKELKQELKGLGYRFQRREPLMVYDLGGLRPCEVAHPVLRAESESECLALQKASRHPWASGEDLAQSRVAAYFVDGASGPLAWVRNIRWHKAGSYVANMYTQPEHRRRGIATALMSALLADAAERGDGRSVLLASNMGHPLYLKLGYQHIGDLYMFTPAKGAQEDGHD